MEKRGTSYHTGNNGKRRLQKNEMSIKYRAYVLTHEV